MASTYTYSFFRVSKTDGIDVSAQKYRDLRLKALKTSPDSFSSTYDIEAAFADADWIERLTLPDRELFICAATPLNLKPSSPDSTQWIGQKSDEEEERWQMLSLFTLPEHRGHGLGGKLCQEAINHLGSYRSIPRQVQVRLIVKAGNDVTVELYRRLGFTHAGRATLVEALIANGDENLLPKDLSSAKYTQRKGLIMISRISRS
ncbi:unnamed protein product [Penicillium discolor]